jgi:hypothetical protein
MEIPTYDGSQCTSSCGNDYDCPHGEAFDESNGIRRVEVQHDKGERKFQAELLPLMLRLTPEELMEVQAELEAKHGEERVSANLE